MYQILHFQNYKYPWIVSLISNASQPYLSAFCAGTLVASRYVVTAASCVGARLPASVLARLGEHDLRRGEGERLVGVSRVLAHPYHHPATRTHDIALLELAEHVDLALYTPACLVANTDQAAFDGLTAQVYGFGSAGDSSDGGVLHELNVTLVPNSYCGEVNNDQVSAGKLCAGNVTHLDTGACQVNVRLLKLAVIFDYDVSVGHWRPPDLSEQRSKYPDGCCH